MNLPDSDSKEIASVMQLRIVSSGSEAASIWMATRHTGCTNTILVVLTTAVLGVSFPQEWATGQALLISSGQDTAGREWVPRSRLVYDASDIDNRLTLHER